MRGTLKTKGGDPIWPDTVASSVTVEMDGEQYPLDAVLTALDSDPVESCSAGRDFDCAAVHCWGVAYIRVPEWPQMCPRH